MALESETAGRRRLAGGALVSLLIQITSIAGAAVTSLVIARITGPKGTGTYGVSMALLAAGTVVFGLDLSAGITFFVSRRRWAARDAWRTAQRIALAAGLLGAGVFVLLQQLTQSSVLRGVTLLLAVVVGLALPAAIACTYASSVGLAAERYETYGLANGIQSAVSLLAVVTLVPLIGVKGAVMAVAASYVVQWLYFRLRFARELPREPAGPEAPSALRPALGFGARAWGADALQLVNYRLDLFILNAYAAQATVGRYALAVSLTALVWVLPSSLQTVLFPRAAADRDNAPIGAALRHAFVLITLSVAALAVVLLLVPPVYGARFRASVGYGFLLLPGVAAIGFAKPLSAVITGRGYPQYSLYNSLIAAPITIALYFVLVPALHGTGAAIASTISYVMTTAIAIYFFRRVTHMSVLAALRSPRAVVSDYLEAARNLRRYIAARGSG